MKQVHPHPAPAPLLRAGCHRNTGVILMQYRFFVTDLFDGTVHGTNDEVLARDYAQSEDFFIVDAVSNVWIQPDGTDLPITELPPIGGNS